TVTDEYGAKIAGASRVKPRWNTGKLLTTNCTRLFGAILCLFVAQVARVWSSRTQVRHLRETLPCNLKVRLIDSFSKQPADEKDHAEQDVNAVVRRAEMKRSDHPHAFSACAQRHAQNAERKINDTEDQAKDLCPRQSSSKTEIKRDCTRYYVNYVMYGRKVGT